VFDGAELIEVTRDRFLPVKTTNDLLVLRSDCYRLEESHHLAVEEGLDAVPFVDLDPAFYKLVHEFDRRFPEGVPSLRKADQLVVKGDWTFGADVTVVGRAQLDDPGEPGHVGRGSTVG
jgi:UTP--glucose-1-phosphate uridylyltransferase